jgi:hypothetical protein
VRAGEIEDALKAGDNDVLVAIAAVILARYEKRVDEDMLWDAPMGSGLQFVIEGPQDPPAEPPATGETTEPQNDGGATSTDAKSDSPESVPSPTGPPPSGTSSTYAQPI